MEDLAKCITSTAMWPKLKTFAANEFSAENAIFIDRYLQLEIKWIGPATFSSTLQHSQKATISRSAALLDEDKDRIRLISSLPLLMKAQSEADDLKKHPSKTNLSRNDKPVNKVLDGRQRSELENCDFPEDIKAIEEYRALFTDFIDSNGLYQLNLPSTIVKDVTTKVAAGIFSLGMYEEVRANVIKVKLKRITSSFE